MKVIDKNGNVLLEKDTHPVLTKRSSLRVMRHTKRMSKTVVPVVMSKEAFLKTINA